MGKVYAQTKSVIDNKVAYFWKPLEQNILKCLEDPFRQGWFHIHDPSTPVLEDIMGILPEESYQRMREGSIHFATNYGLGLIRPGVTNIKSPDNSEERYILVQMLNKKSIIELPSWVTIRFLTADPTKTLADGNEYLFNGTFEEVMQEIQNAGYTFIKPNQGEFNYLSFKLRIIRELNALRQEFLKDPLNEEFVRKLSPEHLSRLKSLNYSI